MHRKGITTLGCARFAEILQNCALCKVFGRICSTVFHAYPLRLSIQLFKLYFLWRLLAQFSGTPQNLSKTSPPLTMTFYQNKFFVRVCCKNIEGIFYRSFDILTYLHTWNVRAIVHEISHTRGFSLKILLNPLNSMHLSRLCVESNDVWLM